ncbi:cubilin homolog [Episyrphus balteatus]|uniref:cubilin homolog n=1 Tax=Episyrphus balteatus TaxID=286459 RepID=UPI0024861631|nr:cubilin homolog [Episyrphus balteatus]
MKIGKNLSILKNKVYLCVFRKFRTSSLSMNRVITFETRLMTLTTEVDRIISKLSTNNCESIPCKNGGTCYNLYEDFNCECPNAWTGKTCETDVDECQNFNGTDSGCQNNGVCINLPGSYRCNCTNGFHGAHCRDRVADCVKSRPGELCGKGQCIPANNTLGYQCLCDAGWKVDNITQSCTVDVNECLESLVSCHTSCINLPGTFVCGPCPNGYTGNGVVCRDINECEKDNGGCRMMPKVRCINTEGSHRCGKCPPGWTGDGTYCSQAETYSCESTNICHPLAKCQYISNVMVCVCPEGLVGSGYGQKGCRSGSANPCNEHNCQNGGTCVNVGGMATCICRDGFESAHCEIQNICLSNPCLNGGTCTKHHNDTICVCPRGYSGNLCQTRNAVCGSVITQASGDLTSPTARGSNVYGPNQSCAWVIRTDFDLILNVTFSRFDIQFDATCSKDWLQINDGKSLSAPVIGRFCGNELPKGSGNLQSSHNTLFLWFHTDYAINGTGFALSWTSVTPICGGRFNVDDQAHGVIKSPAYPGKSPPNRECEWDIIAPLGKRILFRFFEVVMDNSANCTKDALILYDSNEVLEKICETGVPPPKYSSTNSVKVHFHTDRGRQDSLFHMHYEVVEGKPGCGGLLTEEKGKILFTADLNRCVFLIQQPVGTRIEITFVKQEPEEGSASFKVHRSLLTIRHFLYVIKIYDGKTEDDPVISDTDGKLSPGNCTSNGNSLLIVAQVETPTWFRLGSLPNAIVFEANFKRVCGYELRDASGGTIKTPNYPKPYYEGLDCVYSVVGPLNSVVHLRITDFDLSEYDEGCDDGSDFIEIYYSLNGPPQRHCKGGQMHVIAPSNYLDLGFHSNTNPQKRRGISAEYNFEQIGCGGVLREAVGSFELLNPSSPTNSYCEWILEAPDSNVISLDLTYRRSGTKCASGEVDLKIFLNRTGSNDGRLVESHCGDEKRIVTILPSNIATVFLKLVPPSIGNAVTYGIRANYTFTPRSSSCGGNYSLLSGSIQSPGWPDEYFESTDCIWVIHAPLGNKIELIPRNFSLETNYKEFCHDYLEIRNGMTEASPLIGKFCGTEIPPHIPSFTNHLYLHFHSDSSLNYPGFDITFQQTSTGCGGSLTSHTGSIASPHYPELSRGPVQCDWKITISKGSSIDVRITKIGPTANLCSNDVLTIYDGPDSLSKKLSINCSSDGDISLSSSKNVIFIRYVLPDDGAAEDQQFYLEYQTNCQQTLNSVEGVIESPNFPSNYPDSLKCEWTIEGRKAETISLTFSHFELEALDLQCRYDKFEVIDMKGEDVLQSHKICRDPAGLLTSDGNKLVVRFTTDSHNNGNGFRLEYKRNGCGGYKNSHWDDFETPNYPYNVNVDCEWFIEAPAGWQIVLYVTEVHIEGGDINCSTNGLIVKSEKNDPKNLLKTCGIQTEVSTITSQGSTMYVRFYSNSVRSRKYMKASFRRTQGKCGGVIHNQAGELYSPNYPNNYSSNTYCEWMVTLGSERFKLSFESLEAHQTNGNECANGLLDVYDGLKRDEERVLLGRFCNDGIRRSLYHTFKGIMNVIFNSANKPPGKGFIFKYKKVKCGGLLVKEEGTFRAREEDGYCSWWISVPEESRVTVSFSNVQCHCDGLYPEKCAENRGLMIKISDRDYTHICEAHPPDLTLTTSSMIDFYSQHMSYTAKYTRTGTACGGDLTSLRGSLASPFYPESYPSNVECIWILNAPSGNYLELTFDQMNITNSENCNQDYLEIRETSITGRLLCVFCSNVLPTDSFRGFERIWIKFRSAEGSTGLGFRLSWTNSQLNEVSGFKGKIESPSIVSIRSEREPFQWRITVPRDYLISLTFKEYNGGLQLFDGFDNTALPIEIQLSPWQVTSSMNVIYFMTDNQMLDQFIIEWKAISKDVITQNLPINTCNETLQISYRSTVTISSPGYPTGYENNLQCQWLIKPDHPTRHVVAKLYDVRLDKVDNCQADYLKVFSSNDLLSWHEELKICDSPSKGPNPIAIIHGTPYLKLQLTTDSSLNATGFTSKVFTTCGGNLTNSIGRILDTDIVSPDNEWYLQNCTWHIEVGTGRKIQFTFNFPKNMSQHSSDQCENYALIRDGVNDGAPILPPGRICSNKDINGTITTNSNRATVRYTLKPSSSFYLYETPMWNLTYREYSQCNGEVRLTSYSPSELISSPNYPNVPDPHTECIWIIIAPPGETVQVEFVGNFNMNMRQCSKEFIEFRDGATEIARSLGKYCFKPGKIRSSDNILRMRYLTDIAEPRNGFKANVSLSTCGGTFTQYNDFITSANYPAPGGYPANSICEYVIKVSSTFSFNLAFIDIDLPFDAANLNSSDQIRIYQIVEGDLQRVENELAVIYGNTTTPTDIKIHINEVLIRFYSFKANSKFRGFKIKYDRLFNECYKDASGDHGVLTLSSMTPRRKAMSVICRWRITVPKGKRVKLDVIDFDGGVQESDLTKNFTATFSNDVFMLSRITMVNLNNITTSTSISSSDNKMFVKILGAYTASLRRVKFEYSSIEESNCPDDITEDSGSFSVAKLGSTSTFYCSFYFKLNGAQTMSFNISRLNVEIHRRSAYAMYFKDERTYESIRFFSKNLTNSVLAISPKRGSINILQNDVVRIKELEVYYKKIPCGGEYRLGQRFEITMPNLTAEYGSLNCAWQFYITTNKNGHDLTANFSFVLPCKDEFVTVHAGRSNENLEIAKLCQGQTFNTVRLNSLHIYVLYHTKSYNPNSQMRIVFERTSKCSEKLNFEVSSTESLSFTATDYKNNLKCVWDVQASEGYYLQIKFSGRFFIEESQNCTKDFLEIRKFENNDWVSMPRYCGRNLPSSINTTSSRLQLVFQSDEANTGDGFNLSIKKTCYAVFNVTNEHQVIKYPTGWSDTRQNMSCEYLLQNTDPDKYIQVQFTKFVIDHRSRCNLAHLSAEIRSSNRSKNEMGPYCIKNALSELRAKESILINYEAILEIGDYEMEFFLDSCGGEVRRPMWISSMRNEAGDGYANNMNCIWNITAPVGHNIVIHFKYLILDQNFYCTQDYVSIYKGSQMNIDNLEAKLCGNITIDPPSFHIESNSAVLAAISDSSITRDGFSAQIMFSKACDERITLTEANSPVDIDRNLTVVSGEVMSCNIRAMAPPGFRIEIELKELNISKHNQSCGAVCEKSCENVEIVDSLKADSLVLGRYCWVGDVKPKLKSSFEDVVIRTNFEQPGIHLFKVNLRLVLADCGNQSQIYLGVDANSITIHALLGSNGLYLPNTHCYLKITSKFDFELKLTDFSLQNKSDVTGRCLDYVLIKSTKQSYPQHLISELCGVIPPYVIKVERPQFVAEAEITFHSDEKVESTGFKMTARTINLCNRTYTHTSGLISGVITNDSGCQNDILLPENYIVNLYIPGLFYLSGSNSSEDFIRVIDKKTNRQIYEDFMETNRGRKIYTSTAQIHLDLKASSGIELQIFYYASPKATLLGCGGNLEMPMCVDGIC